ncbi:MAG: inositol monophosphatase family protein [Thermoplasmata archaeon]
MRAGANEADGTVSGPASDPLEILVRIALEVHRAVRTSVSMPGRADVVAMGASGSPTERIDRIAERTILACMDAERVDWDLLSEEAGLVRRGGGAVLIADPIDGSHNAVHGIPFASVSLALGREDLSGVTIGLVHDLFRGTTFWARRGGGAYRNGERIRTRRWVEGHDLVHANLGRFTASRLIGRIHSARRIRAIGCASLELAQVAQGSADAYLFDNVPPERNLRVTDIAAGTLIVEEAGGRVVDAEGSPIGSLPLRVDRRTSIVAVGDPAFLGRGGGSA